MWRGIAASIVTAGMLTGAAFAQVEAPPATPAPPAAADPDARARERELRDVQAKLEAERRALDALRTAEIRSAQEAVEQSRAAVDKRVAAQRLQAERYLINARQYRQGLARQLKKERVAYCGVSVSEPAPVLTEQLKLQAGTGLVVDFVVEKSAAETAGVKQYDLLTKLDDQLLTNADQFRALIRMKKPSDDVKLTLIRRGEATSVNVELGQQEVEEEVGAADPNQAPVENALTRLATNVAIEKNGNLVLARPTAVDLNVVGGGMALTNVNGRNQAVWADDKNVLTMELRGGKAVKLTAKDTAGKQLFDGPVETDEQRKALPPELAETLKKAEAGGPVRFRVNGGAQRSRVLTSTEKDTLLLARIEDGKATWAFAFSELDGKILFDGPTVTDEQRKMIPEAVAKQLQTLEDNQAAAGEFGVVGRN
jgi:membrane-associated protease RseP (regulator of RpoE activity)